MKNKSGIMSFYDSERNNNKDDVIFVQQILLFIKALKNSQHCYAQAATLVNASELRNFFEKIELQRAMLVHQGVKAIGPIKANYDIDAVWFTSMDINNMSKQEFDLDIIIRCLMSEETLQKNYETILNDTNFSILGSQLKSFNKVRRKLLDFQYQYKAYAKQNIRVDKISLNQLIDTKFAA